MPAGTLTDQLNHRFGLGDRFAALVITAGHVSVDGQAINNPLAVVARGSAVWVGLNLRLLRRICGWISWRGSITLDIASLYIPGGVSSFEVEKPSTSASSLFVTNREEEPVLATLCHP